VTVVGNPARIVVPKDKREFLAYGTPTGELTDPFQRALEELRGHVAALNEKVASLESQLAERDAAESDLTEADGAESGRSAKRASGTP